MPLQPADGSPREPLVGDVERFLRTIIADLSLEPAEMRRGQRGRPRILSALCLWSGLLVCVLRGFSSQLALWRLLAVEGLWAYPPLSISDQAIYKRLREAGPEALQHLFLSITELLAERLTPWVATDLAPFAAGVVALDATTLDPLARRLTEPGQARPAVATMPGRLLGVFDVRRQQWGRLLHRADPNENEKVTARELLHGLPRGTLVLADLGYFSFEWFDDLTDRGLWWISRVRAKTSSRAVHTFYQDGTTADQLVCLGAHRADRAKHVVRRVQYLHGGTLRSYITNVIDPAELSLHDIAVLYARRWDIEMAVQLVKQHLGVRLWWSSNLDVVEHQLWATLIISQVLMALRMEIAGRAGVDLFDVSMPLMIQYLPRYAARGEDPIAAFVRDGRFAKFIRRSRRIVIQTPPVDPSRIVPLPPDVLLQQAPRHAHRRCQRSTATI